MTAPVSYSIGELVEASGFDRRTIVFYIQQGILPRVGRRGPSTRYPAECLTRLRFVRGVKELQNTGRLLGANLREMAAVLQGTPADRIAGLVDSGLPPAEVEALFTAPAAAPRPAAGHAPLPTRTASPPIQGPGTAHVPMPPFPLAATPAAPAAPPPGQPGYGAPTGARRSYGLADAGIRRRGPDSAAATPTPPPAPPPPDPAIVHANVHEDTQPRLPSLGTPPLEPAGEPGDLGELLRQLELKAGMSRRRAGPGASEQWTEIPVTGRVYLSIRGLPDEDAALAEAVVRALKRAMRP